ncbi:DUF1345 domain-containing protein [Merismopedia glauca]|uniref:DUF1345 domain-containing protein n=1 Tax=Merismopedia glauca CCAP 1448/3 TaxID=1296344 RepID=A0A2T1BXG3_9CYAN|nr:DUF1345 domain-containing protein [Merismopedia glauca]PSB00699.1 DUF1345 domain-containing protein [Merismopedia glauca CCAP 1448/3]
MLRIKGFHPRLIISIAITLVVGLILPRGLHWATRTLCIWDTASVSFLGLSWSVMAQATPESMQRAAQREDERPLVILSFIGAAACCSFLAIFFMLGSSKGTNGANFTLHLLVAIVTIIGSWLLLHTIFAIHYAHNYYQEALNNSSPKNKKALDFPSDDLPDYWDFMYFSFVVGMTSQVSDVEINSRSMRRLALLHGIVSFFFNTVILATSINLIAGLI